jgi:isopentenyldiphosphate isomerase
MLEGEGDNIFNKVFHIARCRALRKVADFDRNEVKEFRWVSRQEIERMIRDRLVRDGFSLPALLLYLIGY